MVEYCTAQYLCMHLPLHKYNYCMHVFQYCLHIHFSILMLTVPLQCHYFTSALDILFPEGLTVHEVLKSINTVVGEWFRLGLELRLPERTLKTIEYNHPNDVETCKRKMVQEWLEQPCPSWCSLAEALSEVGLKHAAKKVSEAFSNSKYSVQHDFS